MSRRLTRTSPLATCLWVQVPVLVVGWLTWVIATGRQAAGFDFSIFRAAGIAVIHGRTPYVTPTVAAIAANDRYVYPEPFAFAFAPFTLLSVTAGAVVFLVVSTVAVAAALRLLGARDWRIYCITLVAAPVISALGVGAIGPLLVLGLAVGWRLRRRRSAGVVLLLAAFAKLFLWPVLVWLLVTKRFRAAGAAAAAAGILVFVWALTDWPGLEDYPATVRDVDLAHQSSYSLRSAWLLAGLPRPSLVPVVVAIAGCALVYAARGNDRAAFALSVFVALASSPLIWLHYLILLVVPLALYRPRLAWPWFVPLALWLTPTAAAAELWRVALAVCVSATIAVATVSDARRRSRSRTAKPRPRNSVLPSVSLARTRE